MKKKLEPKIIVSIFLIAVCLLLIPQLSRIGRPIIGSGPYFHSRIAESIASEGVISSDSMALSRPYVINAYDFLLSALSRLSHISIISRVLPFILGLASLLLFFLLIKGHLSESLIYATLSILVLSPVFIYAFVLSTPFCLVIFINLLGFYLLTRNYLFLAAIVFALTPFFGFFHFIITLLLLFSYGIQFRNLKEVFLVSVPLVVVSIAYFVPVYLKLGIPGPFNFLGREYLRELFSDLGAFPGFSLFTVFLAGVGIYSTRMKKRRILIVYALLLFLLGSLYFSNSPIFYLCFILAYLAAAGLVKLISMDWELKQLRDISVVILFIGITFSSITFINTLVHAQPTEELVQGLLALESYPHGNVLSHYSYGYWIEFYSQKPELLDPGFSYAPNLAERFNNSLEIFNSRNLERTKSLLDANNVKYILVTQDMKQGLVWSKPDEGIIFLFRNNETFKNVYNYSEIEIWEYLPENEE